ncbi:MAG: cytidine deaminase [Bacteroidales bacterium]|nr:cytidine deaminase [Bacteroidales bacterium]
MPLLNNETINQLKSAAIKASANAYCPYSRFVVGAAVLCESGSIYTGCNVENASLGLTVCAERNAVFGAVAQGETKIVAVAVYAPVDTVTAPCGACRQVISEFNPKAEIYMFNHKELLTQVNLQELLPMAFGPSDIENPT